MRLSIPRDQELDFYDGPERFDPQADAGDRWTTCRERDVLDRVRADDDVHELDVDRPPPGWARTEGRRR